MTKDGDQGSGNREQEAERVKQLLRIALPPIGDEAQPERDLWPAMLRRMGEQSARGVSSIPWFDWAVAGGLVVFAAIAPGTIPVILYYL
jgi:hypothetical protein